MLDLIRRLIARVVRLLHTRPHVPEPESFVAPRLPGCLAIPEPAPRPVRREAAPLEGEASALVRPYLLAHEHQERQRELRMSRVLLVNPHLTFAEVYG